MVDPAFTSEKVTVSEGSDAHGAITHDNQKKFEGFTFIPEDEMENNKKGK
jgi:hypothetical protein